MGLMKAIINGDPNRLTVENIKFFMMKLVSKDYKYLWFSHYVNLKANILKMLSKPKPTSTQTNDGTNTSVSKYVIGGNKLLSCR